MSLRRFLFALGSLLVLSACHAGTMRSQTLSAAQVQAIQQRIDQRYTERSATEREAVLKQVVTAIDHMVFVEGGTFEMGDFGWAPEYDPEHMCTWPCGLNRDQLMYFVPKADSRPLHKVRLDSFYLAKYHTTIAEEDGFRIIHGRPLYGMEPETRPGRQSFRMEVPHWFKPDFPAISAVWQEAKDYCQWLGELSGLPVDLPTEAQYEYAARSRGRYVVYPTDTGSLDPGRNVHGGRKAQPGPFPVGSFPPNALGLYEMGENAVSWVNDWYDPTYYENSPVDNPKGPAMGTEKVLRGGAYFSSPSITAMAPSRHHSKPDLENYPSGYSFRCAIQQSGPLQR